MSDDAKIGGFSALNKKPLETPRGQDPKADPIKGTLESDPAGQKGTSDARMHGGDETEVANLKGANRLPSVEDEQVANHNQQQANLGEEFAHQHVGKLGETGDSDGIMWSSHPVMKLDIGPFEFRDGTMTLTPEKSAEFEKLLADVPLVDRASITKIDVARANEIARSHQNRATKDFDSSVGRDAMRRLQAESPATGTKPVDTPREVAG